MKTHRLRLLAITIAGILLGSGSAFADVLTYTFSLSPPSGSIQGPAGSTIGWGYSIANTDATHWLVTTNLTSDPFSNATPDASLFDFPILAPGATAALPYDPVNGTGLFAALWDPGAPTGFTNSGIFTLSAEWWTGDPFAGGSFFQTATDKTAAYLAAVSASAGPGSVPEPASILLLISAVLLLGCCRAAGVTAARGRPVG